MYHFIILMLQNVLYAYVQIQIRIIYVRYKEYKSSLIFYYNYYYMCAATKSNVEKQKLSIKWQQQ